MGKLSPEWINTLSYLWIDGLKNYCKTIISLNRGIKNGQYIRRYNNWMLCFYYLRTFLYLILWDGNYNICTFSGTFLKNLLYEPWWCLVECSAKFSAAKVTSLIWYSFTPFYLTPCLYRSFTPDIFTIIPDFAIDGYCKFWV